MTEGTIPPPPPPPEHPYAPPSPRPSPRPPGARLPWEERHRLGFVTALVETVKLLVTEPRDAFGRLRADGDLLGPFLFGLLLSFAGFFVSQLWNIAFRGFFEGLLAELGAAEIAAGAAGGLATTLVMTILWPVLYGIGLFLSAGIAHVCLLLVGALERSTSGFEGTFKVVAYSSVAALGNVVPLLGGLIYLIGIVVLETLGFAQVHETSEGKAFLAVLIPFVVCCLCGIAAALLVGAGLAGLLAGAGAS